MYLYRVLQKANGEECRNKYRNKHANKSNIKCISSVIKLENVWESKNKMVKQVTLKARSIQRLINTGLLY